MTKRLVWRVLFLFMVATIGRANTLMHVSRRPWLRQWRQRIVTARRRFSSPTQYPPSPSPMISFRRPTAQSISRHFSSSRGCSSLLAKFNHSTVGMTHPYFQSDWRSKSVAETTTTTVASSSSNNDNNPSSSSDEWWPSLLASSSNRWRILRYRQTVGHGWDCYAKVRDAALQWDFATPHQGICTLVSPPDSNTPRKRAEIYHPLPAQSVHQISHGPGRRLMTYSRAPFLRFLFTINPVQVIYDIVDQMEYPVIYTCTAYATCEKHLLQGEERVTVAFREQTGAVQVEVVSCSRPHGWKGRLVWPLLKQTQDQFFQQQMESLWRTATSGS